MKQPITSRRLAQGFAGFATVAMLATGLTACSSSAATGAASTSPSTSSTSSTSTSASASANSSTSASPSASTSASTSASANTSAAATTTDSNVVKLAEAFAATLTAEQKTKLNQEYTFANAANWSNLPNALVARGMGGMPGMSVGGASAGGRVGLQTSELNDTQWAALETLLKAVTGSTTNEGYDEVMQHLLADDYLAANGGSSEYGRGNYFIAFLGAPSATGTWELQFGGHHLAIANTYQAGALAGATPSFRGIEPLSTVTQDGTELVSEQQEVAAFSALLKSLTTEQLATAKLSKSYNDILLGPGKDWAFPTTQEGLKGSELTADQKKLLLAAMNTYVGDVAGGDAILAKYESEIDSTYISFSGTTELATQNDYVRIDGPSVWVELSMQRGIILEGIHPHAVWRDKTNDYGGLKS